MAEEIEKLRSSLEYADRLILTKTQENERLGSDLNAATTQLAELGEELDDREETCVQLEADKGKLLKDCSELWQENQRLRIELAARSQTPTENSDPTGKDLSKVESADLLNRLKAKRKKSKADLADVEAILEMLEGEDGTD